MDQEQQDASGVEQGGIEFTIEEIERPEEEEQEEIPEQAQEEQPQSQTQPQTQDLSHSDVEEVEMDGSGSEITEDGLIDTSNGEVDVLISVDSSNSEVEGIDASGSEATQEHTEDAPTVTQDAEIETEREIPVVLVNKGIQTYDEPPSPPRSPSSYTPKIVFIVPYRDRESHKTVFLNHMKYILEDYDRKTYQVWFIHQKDHRPFNRGAVKNMGFLALKQMFPNTYKTITLVFHDVDTMPGLKGVIDYHTTEGKVKHYYGVKFALGGIVSIKAGDFEKTNGYANFWGWGFEDNILQNRCNNCGFTIDRSQFYNFGDKRVLQFFDAPMRRVDTNGVKKAQGDRGENGFNKIVGMRYETITEKEPMTYKMFNVTGWEIPEHHTSVRYEQKPFNTQTIQQNPFNMGNIMFHNKRR